MRRKGQAELIGALIVIIIFFAVLIPLLYSISGTFTASSKAYVKRADFENERISEKLIGNPGTKAIDNVSPLRIRIIRIWVQYKNCTLDFKNTDILLEPGNSSGLLEILELFGIESLSEIKDKVDLIKLVTARGRVFTIKMSDIFGQTAIVSTGQPFSSENVLGDLNYLKPPENPNRGILVEVTEEKGGRPSNYIVIYNYSDQWYSNDGEQWSSINIPNPPESDLDNNEVNELIVVDESDYSEVDIDGKGGGNRASINMTFLRLILTPTEENLDTITIYFKVVTEIWISGQGNPHEIFSQVRVALRKSDGGSPIITAASTAMGLTLVEENGGRVYVTVISGSATFPKNAFSAFNILQPESEYDVSVITDFNLQQSTGLSSYRVEYVAVTGASINW